MSSVYSRIRLPVHTPTVVTVSRWLYLLLRLRLMASHYQRWVSQLSVGKRLSIILYRVVQISSSFVVVAHSRAQLTTLLR